MHELPSNAADAIASGLKHFFTGKPCRRGHIVHRYTASGECHECSKLKADRYRKTTLGRITSSEYFQRNKGRFQAAAARYKERTKTEKPWAMALRCSRTRAAERALPFDLSPEWAASVWTGACAITSIPFVMDNSGKPGPKPFSASIDRIDQARGYEQDNCRFVLMCVNNFRGTLGDAEMRRVAAAIAAS